MPVAWLDIEHLGGSSQDVLAVWGLTTARLRWSRFHPTAFSNDGPQEDAPGEGDGAPMALGEGDTATEHGDTANVEGDGPKDAGDTASGGAPAGGEPKVCEQDLALKFGARCSKADTTACDARNAVCVDDYADKSHDLVKLVAKKSHCCCRPGDSINEALGVCVVSKCAKDINGVIGISAAGGVKSANAQDTMKQFEEAQVKLDEEIAGQPKLEGDAKAKADEMYEKALEFNPDTTVNFGGHKGLVSDQPSIAQSMPESAGVQPEGQVTILIPPASYVSGAPAQVKVGTGEEVHAQVLEKLASLVAHLEGAYKTLGKMDGGGSQMEDVGPVVGVPGAILVEASRRELQRLRASTGKRRCTAKQKQAARNFL
mmetsp:Transcript_154971/g.281861  ORF Transcript_154971/g.281861 Transcript_154971/m.281861 type:complete len:371 (-) Transcript_154971:128-1240(-)